MKRSLLTLVATTALVLPFAGQAGTTATRLTGTTGPGFTITLKKAGKRVTTLRPGAYTITVTDRSTAHDFVLVGPGVRNRTVTGLAFRGTRSATVTLRRGTYTFYCTPHRTMGMRGTFRVS